MYGNGQGVPQDYGGKRSKVHKVSQLYLTA